MQGIDGAVIHAMVSRCTRNSVIWRGFPVRKLDPMSIKKGASGLPAAPEVRPIGISRIALA